LCSQPSCLVLVLCKWSFSNVKESLELVLKKTGKNPANKEKKHRENTYSCVSIKAYVGIL